MSGHATHSRALSLQDAQRAVAMTYPAVNAVRSLLASTSHASVDNLARLGAIPFDTSVRALEHLATLALACDQIEGLLDDGSGAFMPDPANG